MPTLIHDLPASRRELRLVRAGELKPKPIDWRVDGLFEDNGLLLLVGDPSAGKSFIALDIACSIATGTDFHGRAVRQGPVVYVAGEGHNGLARRLKAWQIRRGVRLDDAPLWLTTSAAALGDPVGTADLLRAIDEIGESPALVVLDTLNRNMLGDENSSCDMRAFVAACDEIRTDYGCTVALVHHTGHADKTRARGSSVLHGAVDWTYLVTKSAAGVVTVECTRMKDGQTPEPFAFALRTVELGFDNENGTPATSAVLEPCAALDRCPRAAGKWQRLALDALKELTEQHAERLREGGFDPAAARVTRRDWRARCADLGVPKNRMTEAEAALTEKGLIRHEGGYVSFA